MRSPDPMTVFDQKNSPLRSLCGNKKDPLNMALKNDTWYDPPFAAKQVPLIMI